MRIGERPRPFIAARHARGWLAALLLSAAICGVADQPPVFARSVSEGSAAYGKGDYARALSIWRPLAEKGDAAAQYNIGALYEAGEGVRQDYAEAATWYRKSAEQGHADAQFNLGNNIKQGLGVAADEKEAILWLTKAAAQGLAPAQFNLALIYHHSQSLRDYAAARAWYERAAEQKHVNATLNLGTLYKNGSGVKQDDAAALRYYRAAVSLGSAQAKEYVGDMYEWGAGVERNVTEAMRWYREAAAELADKGPRTLLMRFAMRYQSGLGIEADPVLALMYAKIAARVGMKSEWRPARDLADEIAKTMSPEQIEEAERLFWRWKPGTPLPETSETGRMK